VGKARENTRAHILATRTTPTHTDTGTHAHHITGLGRLGKALEPADYLVDGPRPFPPRQAKRPPQWLELVDMWRYFVNCVVFVESMERALDIIFMQKTHIR